jgi:hypothetical protein
MLRFTCAVLLVLTFILVSGCGGGGGGTTPGGGGGTDPDPTNITVSVNPTEITLEANVQYQFHASASGGTNSAVMWTVTDEVDGGMITSTGLYTAPSTDSRTCHVRATSVEDPTKYKEILVTISGIGDPPTGEGVVVAVSPKEIFLPSSEQAQFTATVTGHSNHAVTWTVDEANSGTIAQDGTYTAPSQNCSAHVRATSQADPSKSDTALIIVLPGGGPPLPPGGG